MRRSDSPLHLGPLQRRFGAATAGLATIEELIAVENTDGDIEGIDITPDGARELTTAFAERPAAIAELMNLAQHQTFNVKAIE